MLLLILLPALNVLSLLFGQQSTAATIMNFAAMAAGGLIGLFLYAVSGKR